jgi:uncharacterized RDD family membrane protein YckC
MDAPSAASSGGLAPGARLAHYEVRSVLGTGGMGTVYLAHDTALDRPVAVKVLRPEVAGDPSLVDRFVREARAAARVSHPNLTHVHFVGESEGRPWFAMEHCPGTTLEGALAARGPFALVAGLDVLVQAARGLAAAHGAGVVHRDVKPSNLMLLPDGRVKVTDFGLSKSLSGDVQATAGRIMGTPAYMSPEQVRGRPTDSRTDVYLLGLTAWCLFAGRPPFASDQLGEVINDQMNTPLPAVTAARPDLPPGLDALLARMCAKDPAARPASMEEVVAGLEALRPRILAAAPILGRGMATAVDLALLLVAWGGLTFVAVEGLDLLGFAAGGPGGEAGSALPHLATRASALLAAFALGPLLEARFGTTPGKVALHIRVVRADGTPPGWREALLRFALKYPCVAASILPAGTVVGTSVLVAQGLSWAVLGTSYFFAGGRTLGDLGTRTRVVHRGPAGAP